MLDEVKNNFPGALQVPDEKDSFIAVKLSADVREIAFKLHNEYLKETSFFFLYKHDDNSMVLHAKILDVIMMVA